jgi:hypothetical protein
VEWILISIVKIKFTLPDTVLTLWNVQSICFKHSPNWKMLEREVNVFAEVYSVSVTGTMVLTDENDETSLCTHHITWN